MEKSDREMIPHGRIPRLFTPAPVTDLPIEPTQTEARAQPTSGSGFWYVLLAVLSLGTLATIPIAHAAYCLRKPRLYILSGVYLLYPVFIYLHWRLVESQWQLITTGDLWRDTLIEYVTYGGAGAAVVVAVGLRRDVHGSFSARHQDAARSTRRWRTASLWYFLVPLATAGLFSWVPPLHAALRLKKRRYLILGLGFAVSGYAQATLSKYGALDATEGSWLNFSYTIAVGTNICAGLFAAAVVRRAVHPSSSSISQDSSTNEAIVGHPNGPGESSAAPDDRASAEAATNDETDNRLTSASRPERTAIAIQFVLGLLYLAGLTTGVVLVTVGGVIVTLTGGPFFGLTEVPLMLIYTIVGPILGVALVVFLAVGNYSSERSLIHLALLTAAVISNIWIGYGIWATAVKFLALEPVASTPDEFGELIWWNLVDSIPVLDVDATLNWSQPIEEYGAQVGLLLLFQKFVLLFTLARVIQLIVKNLLETSRSERSDALRDAATKQSRRADIGSEKTEPLSLRPPSRGMGQPPVDD